MVKSNAGRPNKLFRKVDKNTFLQVLQRYNVQLSGDYKTDDSIWGTVVTELGLGDNSTNRKLCYSAYLFKDVAK